MSRRDDGEESQFGEVISSYDDKQAVEDGVLANVSGMGLKAPNGKEVNRITSSIRNMVAMGRRGMEIFDLNKLEELVAACTREDNGWFIGEHEDQKLWLVDNEVDGYTLMLPEDY